MRPERADREKDSFPPCTLPAEMLAQLRMPDDIEGLFVITSQTPTHSERNDFPMHRHLLSVQVDKIGGAFITTMTSFIEHKAEATDPVFVAGHEEPPLSDMRPTPAADRGDHLNEALLVIGPDRRNDDPIASVLPIEGAAVLFTGLAGSQYRAGDRLPGIGPAILDRPFRAATLVASKKVRKSERDDRPGGIFLVPSTLGAQQRMDLAVAIRRQLEAAMTGGAVACNAFGIDRRTLRRSPWRAAMDAHGLAGEPAQFALVFRGLEDADPERRLVGERRLVNMEVGPLQFGKRPRHAPCAGKDAAAFPARKHRQDDIFDTGDREAVGALTELHP
ncbi:hypothetical protein RHSP_41073 (plasmid) [Rhizobium freirei PRF 81]|uniref:Uncharacterized protein n=1 Tax=Rhizobium freirei PRF 81 TaxID=363754 RepID=N6USK1_9HYPH|nr:hypothetical protein RHSP_41073 [Rhizobium freirei PRF 81]